MLNTSLCCWTAIICLKHSTETLNNDDIANECVLQIGANGFISMSKLK